MKSFIKHVLQKSIGFFLIPFRLIPVKRNRILFLSLEGGSQCEYSCNPKYLCEYILNQPHDSYELVWLFQSPEKHRDLQERGVKIARHFSLKGFYYCMTSKIVVSNGGYLAWFPFRDDQVRINTWHGGGAYKKLENDRPQANETTRKRMEFCNRNTDLFLSSSELFSRYAIRQAFLYTGKILPAGMPRNDIFFHEEASACYQKVRRELNIPQDAGILLYAPTFRESSGQTEPLYASRLLQSLRENTRKDWYLLTRMHRKASGNPAAGEQHEHCIDAGDYPDTQELLCATDCLITDYSSIVWDFCLTGRPLLLYTPDLSDYENRQGFYLDIRQWGFPLCQTPEDLYRELGRLKNDPEANGCLYHRNLLGSYESGDSCRQVFDYIQKKTKA